MSKFMENFTDGIQINEDFQGWPIYKRTLRWILNELGVVDELGNVHIDKDDPLLDKYPEILEDDGMGYSPNIKYISETEIFNDVPRLWIDIENNSKENSESYIIDSNDHLYYRVDWPEAQNYMDKDWFRNESHYDANNNCWFVPAKYI